VKYALLIYDIPGQMEALDDDTRNSVYGEYFAVGQTPGVAGGEQLYPTHMATTVRVDGGQPLVTDGPFAETKEFLGGFYLLQADDIDTAIEVASRIPAARMGGAVEIRPVVER
jgi:hypothetical protein